MRLYGICKISYVVESELVLKETLKKFQVENGNMSAYRYKRHVPKDDPMLAFSPEEAFAKFETWQMENIKDMEAILIERNESINKAKKNVAALR